ncbi:GNAT family N-acetyltransferase [Muriicola sp. E247]|uniref:GNAT family N-acetyltransferase n=1 Tax=Muriicola sp. E247 TaxID=3242730 RepID=UPI003525651E
MAIENNPFNCPKFVSTWNKHFNNSGATFTFSEFSNITFIKMRFGVYVNVGKRISQGMFYVFQPSEDLSLFKNAVYLIYDVPSYHKTGFIENSTFGLKKIRQYDAYAIELNPFNSASDYLNYRFRSKSKRNFKKSFLKLKNHFEITSEVLTGNDVDIEKYNEVLNCFRELLVKRFESKKETYHLLKPLYWEYLNEVIFELVREKKAMIFILYADQKPVSIHINYLTPDSLILAYPVFDIDYSDYKIGHYTTYLSLEWCFANNIDFYDFSKGHFDYKKRWSNLSYIFEYHIVYNKKSFVSTALANMLMVVFKVKEIFRSLKLDTIYHKFKYRYLN